MARLIDVNKVIDSMQECLDESIDEKHSVAYFAFEKIIECLKQEPTIDAVEVVRCQYCKYYEIHKPKVLENCERNGYLIPMKPNDFCSYGERKNEVNE